MTKEALEELQKEWKERIEKFQASSQSQAGWCRERNINLRTFNYWYYKLKNEANQQEKSTNWLSVKLEKTFKQPEASLIKIKLGNAVIEIRPGFDTEHLLKVVRALNSLC